MDIVLREKIEGRGLVFGGQPSEVPYFTYAVTAHCNYKCSYCCANAENHGFVGRRLAIGDMLEIGACAYEEGVRVFRITGGEPTTWPGLSALIKGIHGFGDDTWVNLNSNGSLPQVLLPLLSGHGERMTLRVSVDRVSPAPDTPKHLSDELVRTLIQAREHVPVRLNMVVTRSTVVELPDLLRRSDELGFDLKLLDLYYNREFYGAAGRGDGDNEFWWANFVPVIDTVEPVLTGNGFSFAGQFDDGGYGIPLPLYTNGNIYVSIKDSTRGTHFHPGCSSCGDFRCQEGLYSPMLSHTGVLHVSECRFRPFMSMLADLDKEGRRDAIRGLLRIFSERSFSNEVSVLLQDYSRQGKAAGGDFPARAISGTRPHRYRPEHGPDFLPIVAVSSGNR